MTEKIAIAPAAPVGADHELSAFDSGVDALDRWLKERSRHNEREGASRTYVVAVDSRVVGYCCLASSSIVRNAVTGRLARNMPDPIPVLLIGRLAVDRAWQKRDLGRSMLHDALNRCIETSKVVGVRAIMVDAISEDAERFYERFGFRRASGLPRTLVMNMQDARQFMNG